MKFKTLLLIASLVLTNSAFSKNQIQLQITSNRVPVVDGTKMKWEKSCDLKDYEGCRNKIYKKNFEEDKRGCELGNQTACANLGAAYVSGYVVERDYTKGKELNETACKAGVKTACINLAILYENGWGIEQDYAKAEKEYKKYCNMGHDAGCFMLEKLKAKLNNTK